MVEANFPDSQIEASCNHGNGAIVAFQPVQEQMKIPDVQLIERKQEQIVPDRIPDRPIVEEIVEVVQIIIEERLQQHLIADKCLGSMKMTAHPAHK